MTSTPESWDDVGCLRLQVDCISQKFEDFQKGQAVVHALNDSQLQKLRAEVALIHAHEQEQKKDRSQVKAVFFGCLLGSIITAILFGCVLAMQIFMMPSGSASALTKRLLDETWKMHLYDFKSPEVIRTLGPTLLPSPERESAEEMADKAQNFVKQKPSSSWKMLAKMEPEPKRTSTVVDHSVRHPQSSIDAEGESHEDGKESREDPGNEERLSPPIDPGTAVPEDAAEGRRQESTMATTEEFLTTTKGDKQELPKVTQADKGDRQELPLVTQTTQVTQVLANRYDMRALPYLSFQSMSSRVQNQGMFHVCFPSGDLEQYVKTYTPVYNEVQGSTQELIVHMYPFCYLDTRHVEELSDERFCSDVAQITFVVEKSRSNVAFDNKNASSSSVEIPTHSWFTACSDVYSQSQGTVIKSPAWFRRIFRPDQDIQASTIEEFVDDVYSGKLPEVNDVPSKRDQSWDL